MRFLSRAVAVHAGFLAVVLSVSACGGGSAPSEPQTPSQPEAVATVTVAAPASSMQAGQSLTLQAALRSATGATLSGRTVVWSSSDESVATVASNGTVTAVLPGSVTMTATSEGHSGSVALSVTPTPQMVGAAGGAVTLGGVTLTLPAGALSGWKTFAAVPAAGAPVDGRLLAGSAITLSPAGLQYSSAATLRATYADASLPDGVVEVQLRLAEVVDGQWTVVADAVLDRVANSVSARVTRTGTFGLLVEPVVGRRQARSTSYANFKQVGLAPAAVPPLGGVLTNPSHVYDYEARAYGDFYGDGTLAYFVGLVRYNYNQQTPETALQAEYRFFRRTAAGWTEDNTILVAPERTCIHPRKALVADFNQDTRPDLFLLCHGYDSNPYPGERNQVLLSGADGRYTVQDAAPDVGFWHGGAAADLNGDRFPDVIAASNSTPGTLVTFLNQGDGTFVREPLGRFPFRADEWRSFFTLELVDADLDGDVDVFVGGAEWIWSTQARYFRNPGNGQFGAVTPVELPMVPDHGQVVDFIVEPHATDPVVYVLRAKGGEGVPVAPSRTVQRVQLRTLQSQVTFGDSSRRWVTWFIPYEREGVHYVGGDDAADGFELAVP